MDTASSRMMQMRRSRITLSSHILISSWWSHWRTESGTRGRKFWSMKSMRNQQPAVRESWEHSSWGWHNQECLYKFKRTTFSFRLMLSHLWNHVLWGCFEITHARATAKRCSFKLSHISLTCDTATSLNVIDNNPFHRNHDHSHFQASPLTWSISWDKETWISVLIRRQE